MTDNWCMGSPDTVVLNRAGVRSFVASAIAAREYGPRRVIALHIRMGNQNDDQVLHRVRRQAEYLEMSHVVTIEQGRLESTRRLQTDQPATPPVLSRPRLVLNAVAEAIELGAKRLILPFQTNGNLEAATSITEQITLLGHLVDIEHPPAPSIETPLLEMRDHHLVELGNRMGLPWELTWSCSMDPDEACRACDGCRRRRAAFEATNTPDPCDQLQAMSS